MTSWQDIRKKRLEAELDSLEKLRCSAIDWEVKKAPLENIQVTFKIRSIVGRNKLNQPEYAYNHVVEVRVPRDYPNDPPTAHMQSQVPFHPNFYGSGLICTQNTAWTTDNSLAAFCLQIAKMLQFDPELTDPNNAANRQAKNWYSNNLHKGLFPTDTQKLPVLGIDDDFALNSDFEILEIRSDA